MVIRGGAELRTVVRPTPDRWLCPRIDGYDAEPAYVIVGGCVFVQLTKPWVDAKKRQDLLMYAFDGPLNHEGRQVVVLSKARADSGHQSVAPSTLTRSFPLIGPCQRGQRWLSPAQLPGAALL